MRAWLAMAMAFLATACSPLSLFNTLAPRDPLGGQPSLGVPYGPEPRQKLDVYRPRGSAPAPTVVFFYGGGWDSGRRQDYAWAGRALAAKGFLTIVPDYRLVPEVRFPAFLEDGAQAVAWARANAARFGGDPDQIVLVGHSAGAYIAAMLGLDQSYLRDAGLDPSVVRGVAGLAGPYDFFPFDVEASQNAFGEAPDPAATQPINFARPDAPPFLLLHGTADRTVFPRNSKNLAARLKEAGSAAEVKLYPDLSHVDILLALSRPLRGKGDVLEETAAFVRRVTKVNASVEREAAPSR